jgi:anaerobic magnesium-protoporphyrin IX monomethyl ester cyclase
LRILLVQSPAGRRDAPIFPVGLAFLAGSLEGHSCYGLDLSTKPDPAESLSRVLEQVHPDAVAVSIRNIDDSSYPVTYWYLDHFGEIMDVLSSWKGILVAGGAGFSIYPEEILELWPRIDAGLKGEGEEALPVLLEHLSGLRQAPPWLRGRLASPPWPDLEDLPPPDYSILPASDYPGKGSVGVQTRRGCVFNCSYCTYRSLGGFGFRLRPVSHVVRDIRSIKELGFDSFMFVDSVFDHPRGYYRRLLEALAEIDDIPRWEAWLSESVPLDTLETLFKTGCRWVDFSPDVITRKGWRLMGKGGSRKNLWPAVRQARKAGLSVGINFFSVAPGEGLWALLLKFLFMMRARLVLGWGSTFVNIGTIRLYRGAPLSEELLPGSDLFAPVFYRPKGLADILQRLFQRIRRARH